MTISISLTTLLMTPVQQPHACFYQAYDESPVATRLIINNSQCPVAMLPPICTGTALQHPTEGCGNTHSFALNFCMIRETETLDMGKRIEEVAAAGDTEGEEMEMQ